MRASEVDPLACSNCGGQMKVVAFIFVCSKVQHHGISPKAALE